MGKKLGCVESRRIGHFKLSSVELCSLSDSELAAVFRNFFVVRAEHMLYGDFIEYQAYSPLFACLSEGEFVPEYDVTLDRSGEAPKIMVVRK